MEAAFVTSSGAQPLQRPRACRGACRLYRTLVARVNEGGEGKGRALPVLRTLATVTTATALALSCLAASPFPLPPPFHPPAARAMSGLVDFPLHQPLSNVYYLVRAGESLDEARGVIETNPVKKTSVSHTGLTAKGAEQSRRAAQRLLDELGFCSGEGVGVDPFACWIWASMTANAYETGEIIAAVAALGHEHLIPEFSYLDKRGVGAYNGQPLTAVMPLIDGLDRADPRARPPPGEDGTPPESLQDVYIRMRELMSKLETQYGAQRASVVIVAADSYPLSVLECVMRGDTLDHADRYRYDPGEVRRMDNLKVLPPYELPRMPLDHGDMAALQRVRRPWTWWPHSQRE
ncbi:hypothetical protein CDCA_CDCA14G3917 [Cyanidium caldarium]|uniref:Uncharacterized protein n=1 Tax=Cyanidium caldarium TaxID=2771 RepID=A0AAV9J006_CYACA|nr:hypothetical protein CDCA_CDCA14G3917 [Cyanidium caldarium]|eukprot:ctg_1755.g498